VGQFMVSYLFRAMKGEKMEENGRSDENLLVCLRGQLSEVDFEEYGSVLWLRKDEIWRRTDLLGSVYEAIEVELTIAKRKEHNLANRDRKRPWRRLSTRSEMQQIDPRTVKRQW